MFTGLPTEHGWDSYNAEPPNEAAVANAGAFLMFVACNWCPLPMRVCPTVVGGIGFTFGDERKVYVEFRNTGNCHALFTGPNGSPKVYKIVDYRYLQQKADAFLNGEEDY